MLRCSKFAKSTDETYRELQGNILDGLSETMQNMGRQASEMAKQGQRLAAKESAKATARSWLPF